MGSEDRLTVSRFVAARRSAGGSSDPGGDAASNRETIARLRAFVVATGVLHGVALVLNLGGPRWFEWDETCSQAGAYVSVSLLILAAVFYGVVRGRSLGRRLLLTLAQLYVVVTAFGIAFSEQAQPERGLSPVVVLILIFPLFVPTGVTRTLATALGAATMLPMAMATYAATTGHGIEMKAWVSVGFTYLFALLSAVPAKMMSDMRRELGRARRLGAYELSEKLGEGGMGEVWRGHHRLLRRPAAIKLIRPSALGASEERAAVLLERFEREAQATARLESQNTVEVYDFGISDDGVFFLVMELLRGANLETLVREHGPLPPERVVYILRQVCDSLDDAHQAGLVHRDIKPANIFLARKGRRVDQVKVLDFGLVKDRGEGDAGTVQRTQASEVLGTPAFMAPELATGTRELDGRTDLYSLGCVAYWLLTGRLLFDAETPMAMAVAHAAVAPVPPSKRGCPEVPPWLESLVMDCLEKEPDRRPPSALEMLGRLEEGELAHRWTHARAEAWWLASDAGMRALAEAES